MASAPHLAHKANRSSIIRIQFYALVFKTAQSEARESKKEVDEAEEDVDLCLSRFLSIISEGLHSRFPDGPKSRNSPEPPLASCAHLPFHTPTFLLTSLFSYSLPLTALIAALFLSPVSPRLQAQAH